jgi:hypothetical protein
VARPSCSSSGSLYPAWDDPEMDQGMSQDDKCQHDACDTSSGMFHILVPSSSAMERSFRTTSYR